jgi:hypothetical protein
MKLLIKLFVKRQLYPTHIRIGSEGPLAMHQCMHAFCMVVWAGAEAQRGERRASAWPGTGTGTSGERRTVHWRRQTGDADARMRELNRISCACRRGAIDVFSYPATCPPRMVALSFGSWGPGPGGFASLRNRPRRMALWLARARGLRRARAGELMRLRHVMPLHPTYCGSLPLPALYGSTYATACTRARLPLYSLRMTLCISSYLRAIRITIDSKLESGSIYIHF